MTLTVKLQHDVELRDLLDQERTIKRTYQLGVQSYIPSLAQTTDSISLFVA